VTRGFKRWIARTLIGVMVLAQLAIAAYACPAVAAAVESAKSANVSQAPTEMADAGEQAATLATPAAPATMNCDQMPAPMDDAAPNLCAQHCQYGQQSDHAQTLTAPAVLLTSLYTVAPLSRALQLPPSTDVPVDLFAAVSPPHAILHCCLRD
jgi:hypothetical protein